MESTKWIHRSQSAGFVIEIQNVGKKFEVISLGGLDGPKRDGKVLLLSVCGILWGFSQIYPSALSVLLWGFSQIYLTSEIPIQFIDHGGNYESIENCINYV